MARLAGYEGWVDWTGIAPSASAYASMSWSLDLVVDMLDVTDFDSSGDRQFIRGLKGWTGTIEMKIDNANQIQPSDVGAEAEIQLALSDGSTLSGSALCNGWHPSVTVDGEETQTLDFQGNGALTYV